MNVSSALRLVHTDPRLVFELAARVEPPEVIARNYDLDPQTLLELMEVPNIKRLIRDKRKELDENGFVLATKAKLMFEDLLADVYKKAKGEGTSLSAVLDAAKFMRTVAGMDKPSMGDSTAEKFGISITINANGAPATVTIGQANPNNAAPVIDVPTFERKEEADSMGFDEASVPVWLLGLRTHSMDLHYE